MNLEQASFIAQIVGGIAVVLSLVYVGVQIKQNTSATMMTAAQNLQAMIGRIEELMLTDTALCDLVLRSARGEELAGVDQWRITLLGRHVLRTWQTAHYLFRTRKLDKAIWEPQARLLAGLIQQDIGFQRHVKRERASLDSDFVAYLDGLAARAEDGIVHGFPTGTR